MLTASDHERIAEAIRAAEQKTAGEIFAVVAKSSDSYRFIPLLWAALAALVAGIVAAFSAPLLAAWWSGPSWSWQSAGEAYGGGFDARWLAAGQAAGFAAMALLLQLAPGLRPFLVPRALRHRRAQRHAMEQFLAHNLHATTHRTGVLIFVSLAEHYAAVIADEGINAKVDQAEWDALVARLTGAVAAGRLADGFLAAIAEAGALLARHFPPTAYDESELLDRLVEL